MPTPTKDGHIRAQLTPPPAPFGLEFSRLTDTAVATSIPQVLGGLNVPKRWFPTCIWWSRTFPRAPSSPPIKGGSILPLNINTQDKKEQSKSKSISTPWAYALASSSNLVGRVWGRSVGLVDNLPLLVPRRTLTLNLNGYLVSVCDFFCYRSFWLVKLYFSLFVGSLFVPMADALVEGPW
jgi:hypothetical protein